MLDLGISHTDEMFLPHQLSLGDVQLLLEVGDD